MNERCACTANLDIPAIVAVCGMHAPTVTHTARTGYVMPCPECCAEGETADGLCPVCIASGVADVTLAAGKAAMSFVPPQERAVDVLLSGRVGRRPRRR